jgi:hypothetical protein
MPLTIITPARQQDFKIYVDSPEAILGYFGGNKESDGTWRYFRTLSRFAQTGRFFFKSSQDFSNLPTSVVRLVDNGTIATYFLLCE